MWGILQSNASLILVYVGEKIATCIMNPIVKVVFSFPTLRVTQKLSTITIRI